MNVPQVSKFTLEGSETVLASPAAATLGFGVAGIALGRHRRVTE
jgi:hypothetical protein